MLIKPTVLDLSTVSVSPISASEVVRWQRLMAEEHDLQSNRMVGAQIRSVAQDADGRWLACIGWSAGCRHLSGRERWLGWSEGQRAMRLHLVANNAQFLVLGERGETPNLASKILALHRARLSRDWQEAYGHPVLVAETFVDLQRRRADGSAEDISERAAGACYRAVGFSDVGCTRGFRRVRGGFVRHTQRRLLLVREVTPRRQSPATCRTHPQVPRHRRGVLDHAPRRPRPGRTHRRRAYGGDDLPAPARSHRLHRHRRCPAHGCRLHRCRHPEQGANDVAQLKGNQPQLLAGAKRLDWSAAAATEVAWRDHGHGRREQRLVRRVDLSSVAGAAHLKAFPGVAQAFRIERVRDDGTSAPRTWSYHLTSLTAEQADARRLGEIIRAHGLIENGSHHIRDVASGEDRCRCRTGHLPVTIAIARSLGIAYTAQHSLPHAVVHRTLAHDLRALSNLLGVWIAPREPPTSAQAV